MTFAPPLAPRLVGFVACTLAVLMSAGASAPRLRASGRERPARAGIVRAGCPRTHASRGWLAPDAFHDPDAAVAHGIACTEAGRGVVDDAGGALWPLAARRSWAAPAPAAAIRPDVPARGPTRGLVRRGAGRAPPLA